MQLGDFTDLAKEYKNRSGYSLTALECICAYLMMQTKKTKADLVIADVGAGTGKLTENLQQIGLHGWAVEPNDAMRAEGMQLFAGSQTFVWEKGWAEHTGLADNSVDWVLMGSSFHWANTEEALAEFYRILKPHGFFTAIWNPRDIENNAFHQAIERKIYEIAPNIQRVSSGSAKHMVGIEDKLLSTDLFEQLFFVEGYHVENMTSERYLGAWRSVNDIQAQAGEEKFAEIMAMIAEQVKDMPIVQVPYKSRAWTVQSTKV